MTGALLPLVLGLACGPKEKTPMSAHPLDERPPIPAPTAFTPATPEVFTLHNGVTVWLLERPELPLVSVRLLLRGGSAEDPPHHPGLAYLTDQVVFHGAGERDVTAFAAFAEQQAIDLGSSTGGTTSVLYADAHADKLLPALDLLADVVLRPRLDPAEVDRVRTLQIGAITQDLDDPRMIAPWVAARLYFGEGHPLAHPDIGTPEGLASLTAADLRASWQQRYAAARAHFVVVGAVNRADLTAALEARFATWTPGTPPAPLPPPAGIQQGPGLFLVDNPDASQTALRVVMPGWPAAHPALPAGELAGVALGGTFTSRLNSLMREEKGYTYGARTSVNAAAAYGTVVSSSSVEQGATAEALTDMLAVLRDAASGFSEEELIKAREANRTELIESMGSRSHTAGSLSALVQQGRTADGLAQDLLHSAQVTPAAMQAAWAPRADLSSALILVVGDLSEIQDSVQEAVPGTWTVVDRAYPTPPPPAEKKKGKGR